MSAQITSSPNESVDLNARLEALENRLSKIETFLDYKLKANLGKSEHMEAAGKEAKPTVTSAQAESRLGEQVFAWISSIIVLFLVVFIMIFFQNQEKPGLAIIAGYAVTGVVLLICQLIKSEFPRQVYLLRITSHLLLFYVTLWLYFLGDAPLVHSLFAGLILISLPVAYLLYFSFRQNSQALVTLALTMVIIAAVLSGQWFVMLTLLSLTAATGLFLYYLKGWSALFYFTIFSVYFAHLEWMLGNPLAGGNTLQLVENAHGNLFYLFSYGFIFAMAAIIKPRTGFRQIVVTTSTIWNAILFASLLMLNVFRFYPETYWSIFAAITVFSLAYSALLKIREAHIFITSFYAVVSFVALSALLYGLAGFPGAYLWLVLQSLLVVSIALWFRSPLIVIANTLMFAGILVFYLIQGDPANSTNLAFAFVAILTARFINWKKERLNLKTESIRNTYLIITFFMSLFAAYHLVPAKFVTIVWVGVAGLFFVLSYVLKNNKYRWIAFATLVASVIYLFFFQLKSMELGFRILAFAVIAIITLVTSFYYSKRSRNNE